MRIVPAAILSGIAGAVATPIAAVAGLGGSQGPSVNSFDLVVYIVDWANVVLFGTDFQLGSARTFAINAVAWSLVGAAAGLGMRLRASI